MAVPYVEVACRLLLATVFVISLTGKVSGRSAWIAFEDSLREMAVVAPSNVPLTAVASAAVEAVIVVCLLVPAPALGLIGFVLSAGLLAVFAYAITAVVRRKQAIACRCFGASTTPLSVRHIVRNGILVAIAILGAVATIGSAAAQLPVAIMAGVIGAVLGMLVAAMDDLVALVRPL